ncbi:MAG: phosphoribosylformylglycinamidine synthase subunit PurS [Syntrophaceticus sp.]|nr:phosphoribosylformylglycinamidine synthase subunit PurS [Syntrophaceticus sp.]HBI27731.1 phosphoribosylformylglycinamidine synthase [Peptococcaceae bacterium]
MFEASIYVTLKKGILDPDGKAIKQRISSLGFEQVKEISTGKYFLLKVNSQDRTAAEQEVRQICDKILVNLVLEDYTFELREVER